MPHTELLFHVDPCWYHQHSHRIHIPILTNESSVWIVEDQEHFLEVGYYYEVNNRKYHTYANRGDSMRIHCIFDLVPQKNYNTMLREKKDIDTISIGWQDRDVYFKDTKKFLQELTQLKHLPFT